MLKKKLFGYKWERAHSKAIFEDISGNGLPIIQAFFFSPMLCHLFNKNHNIKKYRKIFCKDMGKWQLLGLYFL